MKCGLKTYCNPCGELHLGCYGHCDEIEIDVVAEESGSYMMQYEFLGTKVRQYIPVIIHENITLKGEWFNESSEVVIQFFDTNGELVPFQTLDDLGQYCKSYDSAKVKFMTRVDNTETPSACQN